MPERVIDLFKSVEVQHEEPDASLACFTASYLLVQPVAQCLAVEKRGKRVALGLNCGVLGLHGHQSVVNS